MGTGVASPAPLSLSKIAVETARPPKKETTEFSLRALHFVERPGKICPLTRLVKNHVSSVYPKCSLPFILPVLLFIQ